jgi:TRAP-type C4-dicarboxylate transport system permease small subunit
MKMIALVLIVLGVLCLIYGGITYTSETHSAKIGSMEISVKEKKTVNVPLWAGAAAVIVGAGLLLTGGKKT